MECPGGGDERMHLGVAWLYEEETAERKTVNDKDAILGFWMRVPVIHEVEYIGKLSGGR